VGGHAGPGVSWDSGFGGGAHARPKTTSVHHAARRRGGVAARGASAAAGDVGGRVHERQVTGGFRAPCRCIPPRFGRRRLHRPMLDPRRRQFITLLGGAAAWPLEGRAQQQAMSVVGFMSARSPEDSAHLVAAFRRGLGEGGFIEGQNVVLEFRWARGQYDRLPALATELLDRGIAVLVAVGGDPSSVAAKQATSTIPVVFGIGGDPVKAGLVESFHRPGGNRTGVALVAPVKVPNGLVP